MYIFTCNTYVHDWGRLSISHDLERAHILICHHSLYIAIEQQCIQFRKEKCESSFLIHVIYLLYNGSKVALSFPKGKHEPLFIVE